MATDDPITCAKYAVENDLLDVKGWKRLKKYGRRTKKLDRMIKQSKLRRVHREPI